MKKLLFLGAAPTQISPIEYALEKGHYVITCDNKPENPGHRLAHESYVISTTDKEAVLGLARDKQIDGVVAYASDPAAPTAAYVAEHLGLPGNPYESVLILSHKDKFREFLHKHGFNAPRSRSFVEELPAREWLQQLAFPVYVKPVDSSGGKGITVLESEEGFSAAFAHAKSFSIEKRVILEEKIPNRVGYQNDSDVFMVDGELKFWVWGDSHFNYTCSPPFQAASSFPSVRPDALSAKARKELEHILWLLGFKVGAFNVEFIIDDKDEIWFLEVGARNGGGGTVDAIKYATGVDLAKYTVDAALGDDCSELHDNKTLGYWAECLVHSSEEGVMQSLMLSDSLKRAIIRQNIWAKPGDYIYKAKGSNHALGTMILNFKTKDEMLDVLDNISHHVKVVFINSQVAQEGNDWLHAV